MRSKSDREISQIDCRPSFSAEVLADIIQRNLNRDYTALAKVPFPDSSFDSKYNGISLVAHVWNIKREKDEPLDDYFKRIDEYVLKNIQYGDKRGVKLQDRSISSYNQLLEYLGARVGELSTEFEIQSRNRACSTSN